MAEESDRLRQDIENTRASLTRDVDRLADKTSPKRVAQRRWTAVKEKVMGSSDQASAVMHDRAAQMSDKASQMSDKAARLSGHVSDKASDAAHEVTDSVRSAPQAVARQTQGNPLAAGIIAFGVGMLAASLIPVTDVERRAGQQLKDNSGDLAERVKDVATELKDDLSGSVEHAVGEVKETAADAAQTTMGQARSSAQTATDETRRAASSAV